MTHKMARVKAQPLESSESLLVNFMRAAADTVDTLPIVVAPGLAARGPADMAALAAEEMAATS